MYACPECGSTEHLTETGTFYADCDHCNGEEFAAEIAYDTWETKYWMCRMCDVEFDTPTEVE